VYIQSINQSINRSIKQSFVQNSTRKHANIEQPKQGSESDYSGSCKKQDDGHIAIQKYNTIKLEKT